MKHRRLPCLSLVAGMLWLAACGGNGGGGPAGGGTGEAGGATDSGGRSSSGGKTGTGGAGTGGVASGGISGSGGTGATGGKQSSGGTAGQATSGTGAGGVAGTATGGRTATGGAAGATASGGALGGTGGRGGTAGTPGTGGTLGTGGANATGGRSTGGVASGGTTASGGASAIGGAGGAGGSPHGGRWQIMLLGDSITETTCYPKLLAQELTSKGHTNFDFVGTSLNNQSCGSAPNVQTEGHSCYLVTNLVKDVTTVAGCGGTKGSLAELEAWAAEKPDVVLMEYGTNDAWSSVATQTILDAFGTAVDQFRSQNPNVIFFVAQITPLNPSGCSNCEANVEALNAKIPAWSSAKSTTSSPIHVVDVWASLPAATYTPSSTYTADGCHPNPAGSQLMADAWYAGLVAQGIP